MEVPALFHFAVASVIYRTHQHSLTFTSVHRYMSSTLLNVAREHSSVVAVVGKGHLVGIKKNWKQPIEVCSHFSCLSQFIFSVAPKFVSYR